MLRCLLMLFITMLISFNAYSYQDVCDDPAIKPIMFNATLEHYENLYSTLKVESPDWQKMAEILFTLTLVVTILGAIVSALQSLPDTAWKKWVVAMAGILIAGATYFKDTLPEGSYKTFQQVKIKSESIDSEIDKWFKVVTNTKAITNDDLRLAINRICININSLQELRANHPVYIPQLFDFFIKNAMASNHLPDWVNESPQRNRIISKGEGLSISEAKNNAEQDGKNKISYITRHLIEKSFSKPIYIIVGEEIQKSIEKMIRVQDVFFDTNNSTITYWILYSIDEQAISGILNGITFPLTIFSTDLIASKTEILKNKLTEFGFTVTISSAPRGLLSETNTIFVGEGVPVNAIKETVRVLMDQGIPLKAIVYPWRFQKSNLPEIQKINHVQIGGSDFFEEWPKLNQSDLDKLNEVSSQDNMMTYSKIATDKLKAAWGL